MKKCAFLVCVLVFSYLVSWAGTYSGGTGTSGDPYQIANLNDLGELSGASGDWNKYFIQTADINASATSSWNSGAGFSPIGNSSLPFSGTYNGQGHTITGLYINRSDVEKIGMFGYVKGAGAQIQKLGLVSVTISGNSNVGGLVGHSDGDGITISQCYVTGSVTGVYNYIGGLFGYCYYNCNIIDSYSRASVNATNPAAHTVGGLVGSFSNSTMNNCYSTGSVSAPSGVGGLVAAVSNATVSNSFWDTQTSGQGSSAGGTGKTTSEMKTLSTFTSAGWDFEAETANGTNNYWDLSGSINDGYPYLSWQDGEDVSLPVELTAFSAECQGGTVILKWTTESETENLGFIIEKRLQVTGDRLQVADYTTDEALQGHGSTSEAHEYLYTDAVVAPGMTYAYRLADVDYSGKVTWHKEIEVKVEAESEKIVEGFRLGEVFPNPFNATFTIPLTLSKSSPVKLMLCDLNGKVVKVIENSFKPAGEYRIAVNCSDLGSGIYFLQLAIRNNNEIRKMVLIK